MQPEDLLQPQQREERDELHDKLEKLVVKKQQAQQRVQRLKSRLKDLEEPDKKKLGSLQKLHELCIQVKPFAEILMVTK